MKLCPVVLQICRIIIRRWLSSRWQFAPSRRMTATRGATRCGIRHVTRKINKKKEKLESIEKKRKAIEERKWKLQVQKDKPNRKKGGQKIRNDVKLQRGWAVTRCPECFLITRKNRGLKYYLHSKESPQRLLTIINNHIPVWEDLKVRNNCTFLFRFCIIHYNVGPHHHLFLPVYMSSPCFGPIICAGKPQCPKTTAIFDRWRANFIIIRSSGRLIEIWPKLNELCSVCNEYKI